MVISVASGKGGTGKTTVATALALCAAQTVEGVRLLDCDVEAPNASLFIKPEFYEKETVTVPVPEVDMTRCTACGECEKLCQFKAIVTVGDSVLTFPELCHSCGGCMAVCPESAVTEAAREIGVIEKGRRDALEFVHGILRIGEAMAPPLIRAVRAHAAPDRINIIDAPPGTSCPVITAMKDTDYVVLVTEPTPFGLHDLKLAVGAVRILGIPHGLVINRADMGDGRVRAYAEAEGIPVLMEIPFDRAVAEAYARGEVLMEASPSYRSKFSSMLENIINIIGESTGKAIGKGVTA